jgi:Tfp pilus assembly protein PilF
MKRGSSIIVRGEEANRFVRGLMRVMDEAPVREQLREKITLALTYLEDGAAETAKDILRELLGEKKKSSGARRAG